MISTKIPQGMYAVPQQYKQESCNPLILPLSSGFLLSSFLSYNTPSSEVGPLAMFMCIGTGLTGLWGLFLVSNSNKVHTPDITTPSRFCLQDHPLYLERPVQINELLDFSSGIAQQLVLRKTD